MKSLLLFLVVAVLTGAMIGCGGGYSYSPPPPPPGPDAAGEVEDPNAGVSIDPDLMSSGMGQ